MTNAQKLSLNTASDNEAARLAAVRRYEILDTPPDGTFDRIAMIAADLIGVPIAIISIVDEDRIWFKAHHGLEIDQIGRAPGLCASAILHDAAWIVADARKDIRALANPLVAGDFGLQFYAGIPLKTNEGYNLGTLCVIDREPRKVTDHQLSQLKNLAATVMDHLELRLAAGRAISDLYDVVNEKDRALRRAALMAKEIDHRVMNSLQLVSSLLGIQSRELGDSDAASQLALAASRVGAVARVHQHMYMADEVDSIDVTAYLERLCADLESVFGAEGEVEVSVEGVQANILTKSIVPVGLIVNELVTNAAKYGAKRIAVSFSKSDGDDYSLAVADDGIGLAADFDPQGSASLGMKVIRALVRQIDGDFSFGPSTETGGARFTVLLKKSVFAEA